MVFVLGVMRRRHADAIRDMQAIRRAERVGLVLLGLKAVDISGMQHAGMPHVLVHHGLMVFVLSVMRRRHGDAIGDMQAVGRPERVGLVLLGLEAVDISGVQHAGMPYVLVRHRLVVVVLVVVWRRHADALSDVQALRRLRAERVRLVLLGI